MRLTRLILIGYGVALIPLAGCSTWRAAEAGPREVIEEMQQRRVRITTSDGTRVVAESPFIERDSVISVREGTFVCRNIPADSRPEVCARVPDLRVEHRSRTAVAALDAVQRVEVQVGSAARTLGLIALVLGAAYGAAICGAFC